MYSYLSYQTGVVIEIAPKAKLGIVIKTGVLSHVSIKFLKCSYFIKGFS